MRKSRLLAVAVALVVGLLSARVGADQTSATGANEQGLTLISVNTISSAANYQDTTSITGACDDYDIIVDDLIPTTNNVIPELLLHSNGSFQNTNYINGSGVTTYVDFANSPANYGNVDGGSFTVSLYGVNSAIHKKMIAIGSYLSTVPALGVIRFGGSWMGGTTAIDGFELLMSSGNITSGKVKVYCRRPAL